MRDSHPAEKTRPDLVPGGYDAPRAGFTATHFLNGKAGRRMQELHYKQEVLENGPKADSDASRLNSTNLS